MLETAHPGQFKTDEAFLSENISHKPLYTSIALAGAGASLKTRNLPLAILAYGLAIRVATRALERETNQHTADGLAMELAEAHLARGYLKETAVEESDHPAAYGSGALKDYDNALDLAEKFQLPEQIFLARLRRGVFHERNQQFAEAEADYSKAIDRIKQLPRFTNIPFSQPFYGRARVREQLGDTLGSLADFARAKNVENDPDMPGLKIIEIKPPKLDEEA